MAQRENALTRRMLLASPPLLLARESDVLLAPRIIQTATAGRYGDRTLQIAECKFRLPFYSERLARNLRYGTPVIGSPQSSRGTALLLIENKKVLTAYVFGEEHEWQDFWACDLVWNEVTRKWIFGFLTYSLTSFEVNLHDITNHSSSLAYPLKASYKVNWPRIGEPMKTHRQQLQSTRGDIVRLTMAETQGHLSAAIFHRKAGVIAVAL